jgi:prepilin-type N-terminal cleavage/methylation domain-containing protein
MSYMRSQSGFTLLELMIAMVITAIIAGAIASAFGTGLRSWERVQQLSDTNQESAAVGALINADLRSAWLSTDGTMGSFELPATPDSDPNIGALSFTALLPDKEQPTVSGLARITYRVEDNKLYRKVSMVMPDTTQATITTATTGTTTNNASLQSMIVTVPEEPEEVVAENVQEFAVRCWDGSAWQTTWTTTATAAQTNTLASGLTATNTVQTQTTAIPADLGGLEPADLQTFWQDQTQYILPKTVEVTIRFTATKGNTEPAMKTIVPIEMGHVQQQVVDPNAAQ